jgi:hypothetical protein
MRYTAAAGALAFATNAAAQNVVSFELNRGLPGIRGGPAPSAPLSRRDFHTGSINNNITGGGYYVDVQVGTPGQPITMVLDTGSSDAWFVSNQADLCTSKSLQRHYGDTCSATFNPSKSSTYALKVQDGFNITYLDGSGATGNYITDNLQINGVTIKSLQMGLATSVQRGVGVLGVGFPTNEAAVTKYPNIIDQLAQQGFTKSRAFSLYLNDRRAKTGTLLFGGVDAAKFIGPLHTLPILQSSTGYTHYGVIMSSISTTYSNGTKVPVSSTLAGAILDSGTTLSYLPDDIASPLFKQLGVYTDVATSGYSMINCDYLNSEPDLVVTFGFGNGQASGGDTFTISVPVTELVLDLLSGYGQLTAGAPFDNVCLFGIQSSGGSFGGSGGGTNDSASGDITLLGDTFLRAAYVVYDLDHHQIGMAQANLNATGDSNITELTSAGSGLPSVTGVSAQQTTATSGSATTTKGTGTSSPTGSATGGGGGQNTGSPSPSGKPNAAPSARGGGADAFAVVVVAGLFSVVGGALFML